MQRVGEGGIQLTVLCGHGLSLEAMQIKVMKLSLLGREQQSVCRIY